MDLDDKYMNEWTTNMYENNLVILYIVTNLRVLLKWEMLYQKKISIY